MEMEILEKKFVRLIVCFVAFVLLPFTMVATGVESKWEEQEPLLAFLIGLGEINQEMAELLRQNCRLEMLHAKKILQDLKLHYEEISGNSKELLNDKLSRKKLHDMVNVLRLQVKQILIECLIEKNLVLPRTGEQKGSDTWYTRYLGLVPTRLFSSRRELDQASGLAFPDSNDSSFQPTGDENDQSSTQKMIIIIAVVVTAFLTFISAALLFCCCCGARSRRGRNDEKPLLSLSLSDYSSGTPVNEEKFGNQSFNNKLDQNKNSGNFYMESDVLSSSKIEIPLGENSLPPPPGVSGPPGLPQLKPPPGRTYSPRLEPSNTAPPPPVAPPPLPAKHSPVGPRPPPAGPPPPPLPSGPKAGPRPPPPPGGGPPPPRPPGGLKPPRTAPQGPKRPSASEDGEDDGSKTKLKPFFWDKVTANPDNSMVWHDIKSGSFQFNEEMIESLFGYAPDGKNKNEVKKGPSSQEPSPQFIQIIDPKKAQNLSILLKALNVTTEEVCDALEEGNELPQELIQTLLKMAPTPQEELKLRLYSGEVSQLGPVERFLKVLVDIPFAFKRLETLLFMCSLQEETVVLKDSFGVLESACTELRKSRLFLKLLEAVLKTGNRMNDGTFRGGAQAFKLDTLLKLADVRGADGKTTLLHFVVQEIISSEGIRAARAAKETRSMSSFKSEDLNEEPADDSDDHLRSIGLQVVSGLSNELGNVKKASILDADHITGTVAKLGHALLKARDFLNADMKSVPEENGFHQALKSFVEASETDVTWLLEEEKRIMALVKSTADYFHGNAGTDEGLRLFVIVRDFLVILDKVCKEVKNAQMKTSRTYKKEDTSTAPADKGQNNPANPRQRLFPAITDRRMDNSSSDDES